ncbi:LPS-assembly protein LptD [Halioxenophilus aromaticivorans]|uniref:LPS-assembly protein LptD n=2 Tax=Halioxenophilus aromaticivorans TaxID=1306992 RepID=A0AAV3UAL4_9ALTE
MFSLRASLRTAVMGLTLVTAPVGLVAETVNRERIDWQPKVNLTDEQMRSVGRNCTGAYFYPTPAAGESDLAPSQAPMRASADRSRAINSNRFILEGNVQAQQGRQSIEADRLEVDRSTGTAEISGNIVLRDPSARVAAESGHINNQRGTAELHNVGVVLYQNQMRSDASRFKKHTDASIHLSNATLTTCPPGTEDWVIQAQHIDIREDNIWGVAKNPVFRFKNVPYMWLPFITFPASDARLSGFLWPGMGFSDNGGFDLSFPFYFNLAPNYDLMLSPRYIHNRGTGVEGQFRHLSSLFASSVDFALLNNDRGINNQNVDYLVDAGIIEEGDNNPFIGEDRWLLGIQSKGGSANDQNTAWYTDVDFTKVSDQNYFRDLDNTAIDVNYDTHLLRQGTFGYRWDNWQSSITARAYQTLDFYTQQPYQELPRMKLDGSYLYQGLLTELNHELVRFDQSQNFDNNDRSIIKGARARADYKVSYPLQSIWGFFTPAVYFKHLGYQLDDYNLLPEADAQQSFTALQTSLDGGLFFEREGTIFKRNYLQTFEPRLFYFYSDYTDQSSLFNLTADGQDVDFDSADITMSYNQLFRDSRFSGGDRIDDDNRVSVGLTTRFIDSTSGREVVRASLGQIYYLQDRRNFVAQYNNNYISASNQYTDAPRSELAAELAFNIGSTISWNTSVLYDEGQQVINEGRSNLQYLDNDHRLINLGFSYRRKPDTTLNDETIEQHTRQSDISMMLPVSDKVNFIARNLHDFTFERELDSFAGLEYNSCCYRARLVWRRWVSNDLSRVVADDDLNYKRGWFLDIQFKGFGSGTGKFYQLMSETIPGYSLREQAVFPE